MSGGGYPRAAQRCQIRLTGLASLVREFTSRCGVAELGRGRAGRLELAAVVLADRHRDLQARADDQVLPAGSEFAYRERGRAVEVPRQAQDGVTEAVDLPSDWRAPVVRRPRQPAAGHCQVELGRPAPQVEHRREAEPWSRATTPAIRPFWPNTKAFEFARPFIARSPCAETLLPPGATPGRPRRARPRYPARRSALRVRRKRGCAARNPRRRPPPAPVR